MTPDAMELHTTLGALLSSLTGPVTRTPSYVEAEMDHASHADAPDGGTLGDMRRSTEDLLDALTLTGATPSPQRVAAEAALLACNLEGRA